MRALKERFGVKCARRLAVKKTQLLRAPRAYDRFVVGVVAVVLCLLALWWCARQYSGASSDSTKFAVNDKLNENSLSQQGLTQRGDGHIASAARFWHRTGRLEFENLQRRAESGDAASQRELAWAYERCRNISLIAPENRSGVLSIARAMPNVAQARVAREAAQALLDECATLDDGKVIPQDAIRLWLRQAALGGDLEAQVRDKMYSSDPAFGDTAMWDRVIVQHDAGALHTLANATGSEAFVERFGHVVDEDVAFLVVGLAACRLGHDCTAGSAMMRHLCLLSLQCGTGSYEELIMEGAPPQMRERLRLQVDGFMREVEKGPEGWR